MDAFPKLSFFPVASHAAAAMPEPLSTSGTLSGKAREEVSNPAQVFWQALTQPN